MSNILEDLCKETLPFTPEAIVINAHSRHDICPVCSHNFVRSYTRPEGILSAFQSEFSRDPFKKLQITLKSSTVKNVISEKRLNIGGFMVNSHKKIASF